MSALRDKLRLLGVLRVVGARAYVLLWTVNLAQATLRTAVGLVTGLLITRLLSPAQDGEKLALLALAVCGLVYTAQIAEIVASALKFSAARRIDGWHRLQLAELLGRPSGVAHLEDPAVQDELSLAQMRGLPGWVGYTFGTGAVGQLTITARTIGACCAALVLGWFSWWLAAALLGAALLVRRAAGRDWMDQHSVVRELAQEQRRTDYWADVAAAPWAAKELRVFGLADWAIGRFREGATARTTRLAVVRRRLLRRLNGVFAAQVAIAALGLGMLASAAAKGQLSTGTLAVYLGALWGVLAVSQWDNEFFDVQFAGLPTLHAMRRLRGMIGPESWPEPPHPAPMPVSPPMVRFEGVEFSHPGSSQPVFTGLDLEIFPGEILALVGVNGAGKTTFTKLLAGLYQPTRGQITVDGKPLRDVGPTAWRDQLTVVFQDFTRYELSLRENVTLGAPGPADDPDLLAEVAHRAGITDLAESSEQGWDTVLARGYTGGTDLSGGQWQRIALARAFYAAAKGARLLILDEPTSHLDVRAEIEVFAQVAEHADGIGVILISHRLSAARDADRIVVLDGGAVAESGTHDELIALDGAYARMYALQANRFADDQQDLPC